MSYLGFDKLKNELAAKGVREPGALAASIGRKKYGTQAFDHAADDHKTLRKLAAHKALAAK